MREISMFQAFDGRMFDNEDDCYQYERDQKMKKFEKDITFWDCNYKKIPLGSSIGDVYFMLIKTEEAAKLIQQISDEDGYNSPWESSYETLPQVGFFWYDERYSNGGRWFELETEYKYLNKIKEMFSL